MRNSHAKKRVILPDPVYGDSLVTRFVNDMMVDGKKSIAFKIFYSAMELVGKKTADTGKTPTEVWKKAMENITPDVEVKSKRIGGATFQMPRKSAPPARNPLA